MSSYKNEHVVGELKSTEELCTFLNKHGQDGYKLSHLTSSPDLNNPPGYMVYLIIMCRNTRKEK